MLLSLLLLLALPLSQRSFVLFATASAAEAALRFMKLVKVYFSPPRIVLPSATTTVSNQPTYLPNYSSLGLREIDILTQETVTLPSSW